MTSKPEVRPQPTHDDGPWLVYIVECSDGSYYTGVTNDIARREQQHNEGLASRYTRSRRPVRVRYTEPCPSRSAALIRECAVKLLTREQKAALINRHKG